MTWLNVLSAGPYNIALAIALVVGLTLAWRQGRRDGHAATPWLVVLMTAAAGGLLGSTMIVYDFEPVTYGEKSNLGGITAGILLVVVLTRLFAMSARRALDSMTVPTLVAMAIGRVGCFFAECCTGTATSLPWGVHVDGDAHASHPVQLYEVAADLVLATLLTRLLPSPRPGQRLAVGVVGYAAIRFATEFVRADRTPVYGLNLVQWSVLAIGCATALWLLVLTRRPAPAPATSLPVTTKTYLIAGATALSLLTIVLVGAAAFTPLERTLTAIAALTIVAHLVAEWMPRIATRGMAPALGVMMLVQPTTDDVNDPPKRTKHEVSIGGSLMRTAYETVVGSRVQQQQDACAGTSYESIATKQGRAVTMRSVSAGYRVTHPSGTRFSVDGGMLVGTDEHDGVATGPVTEPNPASTDIKATSFSAMLETKRFDLRAGIVNNASGVATRDTTGVAPSVNLRLYSDRSVFFEGNAASTQFSATTADFNYVGIGIRMNNGRGRVMAGAGQGFIAQAVINAGPMEVDVSVRDVKMEGASSVGHVVRVGLRGFIPVRK